MSVLQDKIDFINSLKNDAAFRTQWQNANPQARKGLLRTAVPKLTQSEVDQLDAYSQKTPVTDAELDEEIRKAEDGDINSFWG